MSFSESLGLGLIRAVVVLPRPTLERMQSNLSWSDRFVSGTYLDDHSNFYLVTSLSDGEHHYQSGPCLMDSLDRRDTKWDSINVTQKNMWGEKHVRKKNRWGKKLSWSTWNDEMQGWFSPGALQQSSQAWGHKMLTINVESLKELYSWRWRWSLWRKLCW